MSTKILNGIRFTSDDLRAAWRLLDAMRPQIVELSRQSCAQAMARHVSAVADRAVLGLPRRDTHDHGDGAPTDSALGVGSAWWEAEIKKLVQERRRSLDADWSCSVTIFPQGERLLGMVHAEQSAFRSLLLAQPGIEEYHWQNGYDRPSTVSAAEWKQRKADWTTALAPSWSPSDRGITIEYVPENNPQPDLDRLCAAMPSLTERAAVIAKDELHESRVRELLDASGRTTESMATHEIVRFVFESNHWLRSEAGESALEDRTRQYADRLPETWSIEMLRTPLSAAPSFARSVATHSPRLAR
jgi:hypothetical protein